MTDLLNESGVVIPIVVRGAAGEFERHLEHYRTDNYELVPSHRICPDQSLRLPFRRVSFKWFRFA